MYILKRCFLKKFKWILYEYEKNQAKRDGDFSGDLVQKFNWGDTFLKQHIYV